MNLMCKLVNKIPGGIITIFCMLVVAYFTMFYVPKPDEIPSALSFEGADKLVHFILFFCYGLGMLLDILVRIEPSYPKKKALVVSIVLSGMFYAILTELVQHYAIHGRDWEIGDLIADFLGLIVAVPIACLISRKTNK